MTSVGVTRSPLNVIDELGDLPLKSVVWRGVSTSTNGHLISASCRSPPLAPTSCVQALVDLAQRCRIYPAKLGIIGLTPIECNLASCIEFMYPGSAKLIATPVEPNPSSEALDYYSEHNLASCVNSMYLGLGLFECDVVSRAESLYLGSGGSLDQSSESILGSGGLITIQLPKCLSLIHI